MRIEIIDHPLVAHKLTLLRDENTPSAVFRQLVDELVTLLAYEATHDARVEEVTIKTPITETTGVRLAEPRPIVMRGRGLRLPVGALPLRRGAAALRLSAPLDEAALLALLDGAGRG